MAGIQIHSGRASARVGAGPGAGAGKGERLRALVEGALYQHESALVHYTVGLLHGDWDRARDVVQEAFVKLCRQDPDRMTVGVKAWLYTVCRNRAFDLLRRDARWRTETPEDAGVVQQGDDPARAAERSDARRELLDLVNHLPDAQRDVVHLRFQQGMSYDEIARVTGLKTGTVGFLLHEAMKSLRAALGQAHLREEHGR